MYKLLQQVIFMFLIAFILFLSPLSLLSLWYLSLFLCPLSPSSFVTLSLICPFNVGVGPPRRQNRKATKINRDEKQRWFQSGFHQFVGCWVVAMVQFWFWIWIWWWFQIVRFFVFFFKWVLVVATVFVMVLVVVGMIWV